MLDRGITYVTTITENFIIHDSRHALYLLVLTAIIAISYHTSRPQASIYGLFPRAGGTIFQSTAIHNVVAQGYKKVIKPSEKPIVVRWWAKDYLIMPTKYLAELRTAEWTDLHFFKNISDALFLHTTVGDLYTSSASERMVNVVKRSLNPRLPQLTPIMLEEINYGFEKELEAAQITKHGKEVTAMPFFSNIVHRCASRIMIGSELCRDEKYLEKTKSLLSSIFLTALVITKLPLGPFRPALAWLLALPHKRKLRSCAKTLQPIIAQHIENRKSSANVHTGDAGDAIEWTLDYVERDRLELNTLEKLSYELLHNLWAASSAPGGMITEIIYQMLTYPEHIETLRAEAEGAVKEHGWSEKMLARLHFQDSFIREVNRLTPTGSITCCRTVVGQPFEFKDGLRLPVGTRLAFPIKAIQSDPDNFDSPMKFDGFRIAKKAMIDSGGSEYSPRWSLTAMSSTNLVWGYGNHICPGRFFAVKMIKLIFTKLLIEYKVIWIREAGIGGPKCVDVEGQFVPNLKQKIFLQSR